MIQWSKIGQGAALLMLILIWILPIHAQETIGVTPTPSSEEVAEDIVGITVNAAENTANTVQTVIDRLIATPKSDLARVLLVIGGVVLLVAGWQVYDFIILIAGAVIGSAIAVSLVTAENDLLIIAALLIGGFLGAILSVFLYSVAVFIIGAYIGIVLTNAIGVGLGFASVSPLALLFGGVIGGIVLVGLSFEFLVVLSALVGAQMLSLGLGLGIVWTILFAVLGVGIQTSLMRRSKYDFRRRRRRINFFRRIRT